MLRLEDYTRHVRVQERAQRMYLRARDYCLRSLELGSPGITKRLTQDPEKAVATLQKKDVPLLYLDRRVVGQGRRAQSRPPRIGRGLSDVQALVRRALELDESWNFGAIHVAMISLEALPASMGGDRDRAARHYERAVALTRGNGAVPHLSYATGVLLPQQKRAEFVALLQKALAVNVDVERPLRLENILAQQYARYLLDHLDALFLSDKELEHASAHYNRRRYRRRSPRRASALRTGADQNRHDCAAELDYVKTLHQMGEGCNPVPTAV